MIIIYEPGDMNERARSKPGTELTLHDVHPQALANPTIYIAADGVARRLSGSKQDPSQEFEIRFIKLD